MKEFFIKLMEVAEGFGTVDSATFYKYDGSSSCWSLSGKRKNGEEFTLRFDIKEAHKND
jgi:hypothetical protein